MFHLDIQIRDEFLKYLYEKQIEMAKQNSCYFSADSGFDLFFPEDMVLTPHQTKIIDLKIRAQPKFAGGYYLVPRSSLVKTPLRQKNSVGIIDHKYRKNLMVGVENNSETPFEIKKGERLFQLVHPTLIAMNVTIVDKVDDTERLGFGSTGK